MIGLKDTEKRRYKYYNIEHKMYPKEQQRDEELQRSKLKRRQDGYIATNAH